MTIDPALLDRACDAESRLAALLARAAYQTAIWRLDLGGAPHQKATGAGRPIVAGRENVCSESLRICRDTLDTSAA